MNNELTLPEQPSLTTERLVLRPMMINDGSRIHELVNDKDIAYGCVNIPYPYPKGAAEAWIADHPIRFAQQQAAIFAITKNNEIVGANGLEYKPYENRFEIGYWIGKPYWGNGYATEATKALLDYALNTLEIAEVYAESLVENTASRNVLTKAGMTIIAKTSRPCHAPFTKNADIDIFCIERVT